MGRVLKIAVLIVLIATIGVLGFIIYRAGLLTSGGKLQEELKETTYSLGEYMVNLDEPNYRRYIKVKISVGYNVKKLDAELVEKASPISDIINTILRSKKLEDVNTAEKTESIKNEIKDKINSKLTTGKLANVYFDEIIVQ